ncbi:hypothetical protein LVJ82_15070 [Vitreoscilla massiliensis]|uniref:Uncharacterized protein n=1 Tax=Vitreoscilla massiliensis TaxID=1689272 RepID=A0ABY4DZ08_9NEIS|nr:hypothetical protein [Vitreoscilla massiliensis]UOO88764.1 hypothetical protein LVJ82_15070 [Vitreoscilla massiliensis]
MGLQGWKKAYVLLGLGMWAGVAGAAESVVSAEQWLSRKAMTCDINNTHIVNLSTAVTDEHDRFHFRHDASKQTLLAGGVSYQGVRAAEVLKQGSSSQLALALQQPRFGLQVIKVAVYLQGKPYESFGYYWVAQGSISDNLPALKQLFSQRELDGGRVTQTAQGNVRVNCTIAG